MSKHLISRVVMLPDGTAHIALSDRQTVACTPANLSELLSDPYGFIEKGQFDHHKGRKSQPQRLGAHQGAHPSSDLQRCRDRLRFPKTFSSVICIHRHGF